MSKPEKTLYIYKVLGDIARYEKVSYIVDGHEENDVYLSSDALASYYMKKDFDVKVFYICPCSMVEDKSLLYDFNENKIKEIFKDKISSYSKCGNFDVIIVNSIGRYRIGDVEFEFESAPNNIQLQLFFEMLKHERNIDDELMIIADISTGYNLYVSTLLEALRAIIVKRKLQKRGIKAKYAISEPIMRNLKKDKYRIYLCEYDVKAFFESPIRGRRIDDICKPEYYIEVDENLKMKIGKETEYLRKNLKNFLDIFTLAFNSIKYNTPLAFYTRKNNNQKMIDLNFKIKDLENGLIEFFTEKCEGIIKPKISKSENKIYTYTVKDKELINIFYSMAIYTFIKNKLEKKVEEDEPNIFDILLTFSPLYKELNLSLNDRFLKREIKDMKVNKDIIPDKWTEYREVIRKKDGKGDEKSETQKKCSNTVRNFFAHSGFESSVIEVKRDEEKIRVRYKSDKLNDVESWIKESPEKIKEDLEKDCNNHEPK
ncbi:MAG: TM1812 family CRISPR-associated protein [Candidatus Methanomethylicia archaeon]